MGSEVRPRPGDRRLFRWLCQHGGRRLRAGCLADVGVWPVVEATVGERSAQALMEEQEEQCDLNPLGGKKVGVARAVALQESVPLEFAQIVAKLVEAVSIGGEVEGAEDGLGDFACRPIIDMSAGVQQELKEADDAGVVDFDAGVAD